MYNILILSLRFIVCLFFITSLISCKLDKKNTLVSSNFDINQFIDQQIIALNKDSTSILKTININGNKESKTLQSLDFEKELNAFRDGDINKSAWIGGFVIDSSASKLSYTRLNEKIPVKLLSISKKNNNSTEILIVIERKNLLYHTIDSLVYKTDYGYEIKKYQKVYLSSPKTYSINSIFK